MKKIVLGSSSPRRRELLAQAGIDFEVIKPQTEERRREGESAEDYVVRNSREKAEWVFQNHGGSDVVVIAADTVVVLNDDILEKPRSEDEAARMLESLSNQTHRVLSGFSIMSATDLVSHCVCTKVTLKELSKAEIERYIATGEPMDKAGSYGAQGKAAYFIRRLEGSYTNVVGLPMVELCESLASFGVS